MIALPQLGLHPELDESPNADFGIRQALGRLTAIADGQSIADAQGIAARKIHLVGAAGSGMSALADVLRGSGCILSGSDNAARAGDNPNRSAWIRSGHAAVHVPGDCDLLVFSPAVPADNVELAEAKRIGVPTFSYPQMLGQMMSGRRGLAVAGTHGKSTTTAMTAAILAAAKLDATVVMGATPQDESSSGKFGSGPLFLSEACEYRNHFHCLRPELAVLLGIEWDHVDCFPTLAHVEAAFDGFVARVPRKGLVIASEACPLTRRVVARGNRRHELFGWGTAADWRAIDPVERRGCHHFAIQYRDRVVCRVALQLPGRHNVLNALAAAALAWHAGADAVAIQAGLEGFRGLKRRLEWLGDVDRVAVVDDYAHHPTEVAASLAALRAWFGNRRIWCVFQPHQAARTRALLDEFARSMHNADRIIVADVFLAREPAAAADHVRAAELAARIAAQGGRVAPVHALDDIRNWLRAALRPGDVLVTMGAGDIGKIAHEFVQRF